MSRKSTVKIVKSGDADIVIKKGGLMDFNGSVTVKLEEGSDCKATRMILGKIRNGGNKVVE